MSERVRSGLKLSYEVTLADGELTIMVLSPEGEGGLGLWLRSVLKATAANRTSERSDELNTATDCWHEASGRWPAPSERASMSRNATA